MPPKPSTVTTRSKSIGKQTAPAAPAPPLPPSAPPSSIAVSGYPALPPAPNVPKTKTPLSALHFGKNPTNTYSMLRSAYVPLDPVFYQNTAGSKVKGKAPASPSASSTSTISSPNAFAALSDHQDTYTVEEQATLDLLGLDSFADSRGGDISSSWPRSSSPDPIKALARRLGGVVSHTRPPTPPGTTSGAGSSSSSIPELGCAQNTDGSLRDAADIVFFNDPDDDNPLPTVKPTSAGAASTTDDSPFLAPTSEPNTTYGPTFQVSSPPAPPVHVNAGKGSSGRATPASPITSDIAAAAAAAGRARQARSSTGTPLCETSLPPSDVPTC